MDSLGKTLGTFFEERLTNPLISSFVIAWSLYNYKVFVILLSKNTVTETFLLMNQRFPDWSTVVIHGFIIPAIFAALYLFVLPLPTKWVYKWVREKQKAIDDIRDEYESHKRLTREQSIELRRSARENELAIEDLQKTNRELKEDLNRLQTELKKSSAALLSAQLVKENAETEIEKLKLILSAKPNIKAGAHEEHIDADGSTSEESPQLRDALTPVQWQLLEMIGKTDRLALNQAREAVAEDQVVVDFSLEDLVEKQYVKKDFISGRGGAVYYITQRGRRELLKRKPGMQIK